MLSIAFMSTKGSIYRLDSGLLTAKSRQNVAISAGALSVKFGNAGYYPDRTISGNAVLAGDNTLSKDMAYTAAQALGARVSAHDVDVLPLSKLSTAKALRDYLHSMMPKADVRQVLICAEELIVEQLSGELSAGRKLRPIEAGFGNVSVLQFDTNKWHKTDGRHLSGAFAIEHQGYDVSQALTHVSEDGQLILAPTRETEYAAIAERNILKKSAYKAPGL